jgi:hypothetical protein
MKDFVELAMRGKVRIIKVGQKLSANKTNVAIAIKVDKKKEVELSAAFDDRDLELISTLDIIRETMPAQMDRLTKAIQGYADSCVEEREESHAMELAGADY